MDIIDFKCVMINEIEIPGSENIYTFSLDFKDAFLQDYMALVYAWNVFY